MRASRNQIEPFVISRIRTRNTSTGELVLMVLSLALFNESKIYKLYNSVHMSE